MTPEDMDKALAELGARFEKHIWAKDLRKYSRADREWWVRYESGEGYQRLTRDETAVSIAEFKKVLEGVIQRQCSGRSARERWME